MPFCQGTKHNGYSLVAIVIDLCRHHFMIRGKHGIKVMPCSRRIIIDMLPEIHTMEKCDFLTFMIHSQII